MDSGVKPISNNISSTAVCQRMVILSNLIGTSECGLGLSVLNRHDIWNIDALKKVMN